MSESELMHRITMNPSVCHGKPCIRGLRYPVEFILEMLSGPTTVEKFLSEYSDLTADDIKASFAYAARMCRVKRLEPVAA